MIENHLSRHELLAWISDLQSGMYINCVYCGHRYGPNEMEIPADALRRHVASCPEHPMSKVVRRCKEVLVGIEGRRSFGEDVPDWIDDVEVTLRVAVEEAEE